MYILMYIRIDLVAHIVKGEGIHGVHMHHTPSLQVQMKEIMLVTQHKHAFKQKRLCPSTRVVGVQSAIKLLDTANCSTITHPVCRSGLFNINGQMLVLVCPAMPEI